MRSAKSFPAAGMNLALPNVRCSGRLFLQVGNGANSRALRVLDYGKTSHFGDVLRPKHDFPAKLFRLFRSRIDVVYRYVAEPCRGHSLRVRRYRHDSALTHVGSAVLHDRVGEVGHRQSTRTTAYKTWSRRRIGGQELIPA